MFFTLIFPLGARTRFKVRALVRLAPVGLPAEECERDEQAQAQPRGRAEATVAAKLPEFVPGNGPEHRRRS